MHSGTVGEFLRQLSPLAGAPPALGGLHGGSGGILKHCNSR
jgi:hypothetical protein